MGAVIFCNIAWMSLYRGINDNDKPKNGGSWVGENNDAMESLNFCPRNGRCYGYVEHGWADLRLERLDNTAVKADILDDVTVIWVATGEKGSCIVGWYENAEMYRKCQEFEDGNGYYFAADVNNAYRIPVSKRDFPVPRAAQAGKGRGMGQSNVWYADSDFAKGRYIPKVLEYLAEMKDKCRIAGFSPEELKSKTNICGKTNEELLEMAVAASDDGDVLRASQITNQILAQEESPCGFIRVFKGLGQEAMYCYDEAIESYEDALKHFTDEEYDRCLDIDAKEKLSRMYRLTGKNFLSWHMEEEIFTDYKELKDNAGMVDSLLEMMSIAHEENDLKRIKKLIDIYDDIGTKYCSDEVDVYRKLLK